MQMQIQTVTGNVLPVLTGLAHELIVATTACLGLFKGKEEVLLNGKRYVLQRLLAEGGFSFVYVAEEEGSAKEYALKKVVCHNTEAREQVEKEVRVMTSLRHPNIATLLQHQLDRSEAGKTVFWLLMPFYPHATLQDRITDNLCDNVQFDDAELLKFMIGTCEGLLRMHTPAAPSKSNSRSPPGGTPREGGAQEEEGDPLMGRAGSAGSGPPGSFFIHRDIKPANIAIDEHNQPVLIDLGSTLVGPVRLKTGRQASAHVELAAAQSTLPYRAPELFEIRAGTVLDGKADVWSVGCTLFACLFGGNPFELVAAKQGGTLENCIQLCKWNFPDEAAGPVFRRRTGTVGEAGQAQQQQQTVEMAGQRRRDGPVYAAFKEVIRRCLVAEPEDRADVGEVLAILRQAEQSV